MFSTIVSQTEVFTTSGNSFKKTGSSLKISSQINIFREIQILYTFSTLSGQVEAFTTFRNGFQKNRK